MGDTRAPLAKPEFSMTKTLNGQVFVLVSLAALWLLFFNELREEWQVNPQYGYGFLVPFLGLSLLWQRWPDRPPVATTSQTGFIALLLGLLALQLPFRLIAEANPEWRLLYWVQGFQVLGLTFGWLYFVGGKSWLRHFGPALVFLFMAIPWPVNFEKELIQNLMRFVAAMTTEVAGWMGIPAVQHGNLIEVGAGVVGIEEACSGVRSLQSALMISLFLGEMYRFSALRRTSLLGASIVLVLIANVARTSFLVWAAAHRGLQQMEAWHDLAGNIVMWIILPSLMGLAYLIKPKTAPADAVPAPQPPEASVKRPSLPRWIGLTALVWLFAVQGITELWYRSHERHLMDNVNWSVAWPEKEPGFARTAVPEKSLAILRCSQSEAARWQDDSGNHWSGFLLHWEPGRNSEQLAKGHRPDICFPAIGAKLVGDFGRVTLAAEGFNLTFRHQSFEVGPQTIHVFFCLWSEKISPNEKALREDSSYDSRFQAVLAGKRNLGQKVFEIVVQGPDTGDAAVALFKNELPKLARKSKG